MFTDKLSTNFIFGSLCGIVYAVLTAIRPTMRVNRNGWVTVWGVVSGAGAALLLSSKK